MMPEMKLSSSHYRRVALNCPKDGSRGRNGTFTATEVSTLTVPTDAGPEVVLTASSRRLGLNAPILLVLSPEDALVLAEDLRQAATSTIAADVQEVAACAAPTS